MAAMWVAFLLAILAFLVVYPVLTLLFGALTDINPLRLRLCDDLRLILKQTGMTGLMSPMTRWKPSCSASESG